MGTMGSDMERFCSSNVVIEIILSQFICSLCWKWAVHLCILMLGASQMVLGTPPVVCCSVIFSQLGLSAHTWFMTINQFLDYHNFKTAAFIACIFVFFTFLYISFIVFQC